MPVPTKPREVSHEVNVVAETGEATATPSLTPRRMRLHTAMIQHVAQLLPRDQRLGRGLLPTPQTIRTHTDFPTLPRELPNLEERYLPALLLVHPTHTVQ